MTKAVAINGSPRREKGNTSMILTPFIPVSYTHLRAHET